MKRATLFFVQLVFFTSPLLLSCSRDIGIMSKSVESEITNRVKLKSLSIEEAESWYKNVLTKTPKSKNRLVGQNENDLSSKEKEVNFLYSITAHFPNENEDFVIVPLTYEGVYDLKISASSPNLRISDSSMAAERPFLNNLVIYKQSDGSVNSCIMRAIPYGNSSNSQNTFGISFSGEIQYFDWNENFIFGHVFENGNIVAKINSINTSNTQSNKNLKTTGCQWVTTSTCYYYYVCYRDNNGQLICGDTHFNGCYVTSMTCESTFDSPSGYSGPIFYSGGGAGVPVTSTGQSALDATNLARQLESNPYSLLQNQTDCPQNVADWIPLGSFTPGQNITSRIYSLPSSLTYDWNFQYLAAAGGMVMNCDYFSVNITQLPSNFSNNPAGFLNHIRLNINSFVDTQYSEFYPHPDIPNEAQKWANDPLGSVIYIDIPGNDGSVVVSDYAANYWTFSTLKEPRAWNHPVSGNRKFGYIQNSDGSYTFYVRGVDRIESRMQEIAGQLANPGSFQPLQFTAADALWGSLIGKIREYVIQHNGSAGTPTSVIKRPDWYEVKDVMTLQKPASSINCK